MRGSQRRPSWRSRWSGGDENVIFELLSRRPGRNPCRWVEARLRQYASKPKAVSRMRRQLLDLEPPLIGCCLGHLGGVLPMVGLRRADPGRALRRHDRLEAPHRADLGVGLGALVQRNGCRGFRRSRRLSGRPEAPHDDSLRSCIGDSNVPPVRSHSDGSPRRTAEDTSMPSRRVTRGKVLMLQSECRWRSLILVQRPRQFACPLCKAMLRLR